MPTSPREARSIDLYTATLGTLLVTGLGADLDAQHRAGLLVGTPPAGIITTTWGAGVGAEIMLRIPGEAYRGLGTYVPPAASRVLGAVLNLRDTTLADGELLDLHIYLEDGATNRPTLPGPAAPGTTAVASVRNLTTPAGRADHTLEVLFPAPVLVPIGSDLFVSVHLRSPGLRVKALGGTGLPGFATSLFDACGTGLAQDEYFSMIHDAGALTPGGSATVGFQPLFDLLIDGAGGAAVARLANNAPPTASFYSGLHPDSASPSNQPGRHDLPGYVFQANGTVPTDTPVFLLGSLQPFSTGPWLVLQPGNAILHLQPFGLVGLAMGVVGQDGSATMYYPVPASPVTRGIEIRSQAFAFDSTTGTVQSGPAARQRF